jgi:ubiquinone/menaquinone biosynthesis C-methylase UbiE
MPMPMPVRVDARVASGDRRVVRRDVRRGNADAVRRRRSTRRVVRATKDVVGIDDAFWTNDDDVVVFDRRDVVRMGIACAVASVTREACAAEGGRGTTEVREAYDGYASTYDDLDGGAAAKALGLDEMRAAALRSASGDVLELAVGTGLNLPAYDLSNVKTFTAIDLSPGMLAQAKARAAELNFSSENARFVEADATALPFEDESFDFVFDTFSLCVIEDPVAALKEVRRVLRKSGRAVLIEHSKSDIGPLGAYQDLTSKPVKTMAKGCVWNQNVESLIEQSGLRVVKSQRALLGLLVVVEATP